MKLTTETFERVKLMLESFDQADVILGLSTIDVNDFKNNYLYALLMAKEANIKQDKMWEKHAPNMYSLFINLGINLDKPITFETVIKICKTYEASLSDIQFILDRYAGEMRQYLNASLGLKDNPIEKLTIKINDYDIKSGTTSVNLQGSDADRSILRDVPTNAEQTLE